MKQYFSTRTDLAPNSLLFCSHSDPSKPANVKDLSRAFKLAARKLEKTGAIDFEIRRGKPSELRFYTLRKFFRKQAHQLGFENVNYLMGHTVRGSDADYKPQDPEFYRKLYAEKAMPFLRLETATPTETEKTIAELKKLLEEKDKEMGAMKETIVKIQPLVEFVNSFRAPKDLKAILDGLRDDYMIQLTEDPRIEVDQSVFKMISETAAQKGITQKEAFEQIVRENYKQLLKDDGARRKLAKAHGMPMTKKEYEKRKA
jgi:hypothetical protein